MDRRKLVAALLSVVAVAQAVSAAAPSLGVLLGAVGVMSLTAVVAPILVAFAATLTPAQQRGAVTGKVMTGVLIGVLLARTEAGLIAQVGGWRTVYGVAAVLMAIAAFVLYRTLPSVPPAVQMPYGRLLRSVFSILREEPTLQLRCLYGFFSFAGLHRAVDLHRVPARPAALQLQRGRHRPVRPGGRRRRAGRARRVGPLVDRGRDHLMTGLLLAAIVVSWALMDIDGGHQLAFLILGIIVLDLGVQGMQVTNLSVNFRLRAEARSRITTAYMTTYFGGAVAGAATSGAAYAAYGWDAVVVLGLAFGGIALLIWVGESIYRSRHRAPAAS